MRNRDKESLTLGLVMLLAVTTVIGCGLFQIGQIIYGIIRWSIMI